MVGLVFLVADFFATVFVATVHKGEGKNAGLLSM
jgi:hypothetical protein